MLMQLTSHNAAKGIFFTFASVALISLSPVLHKLGLTYVKPLHAATLWCLFSALFSLMSIKIADLFLSREVTLKLFTMALFSSMGVLFLFYSLNILDPSTVAFANRSYVLFVILLGIFILKEPVTRIQTAFFFINFLGLLMFSYKGLNYLKYHGILFVIFSAFLFSYANMNAKIILKSTTPALINFYSHFFSFLILLPLTIFFEPDRLQINYELGYILLSAFTAGYLGMLFYYKGLYYYSFSLSGVIRALSPIFTTLYAFPLFGISYNEINVIGIGLLIVSSIFLLKGAASPAIQLNKNQSNS